MNGKDFFDNADFKLDDGAFAKEYIKHFSDLKRDDIRNDNLGTICFVRNEEELYDITKVLLLLNDSTFITNPSIPETEYDCEIDTYRGGNALYEDRLKFVSCNNLEKLGAWLKKSSGLLKTGCITYLPRTKNKIRRENWGMPLEGQETSIVTEQDGLLFEMVQQNYTITHEVKHAYETRKKITELQIPFFKDIGYDHYIELVNEQREDFLNFRKYIHDGINQLSTAVGNGNDTSTFQKKMENDSKEIVRDMKHARNDFMWSIGKDITGIVTATLVQLNLNEIDMLTNIIGLGAGGGIIDVATSIHKFYKESTILKKKQTYFFWLLSKKI